MGDLDSRRAEALEDGVVQVALHRQTLLHVGDDAAQLELERAVADEGSGIFIREDGQTKQITRAEWDARFPGRDPVVMVVGDASDDVFHSNITHNLNRMAQEADICDALWRPDENGLTVADQLITPLRVGLDLLRSDPERFKRLNPANGWGTYELLVDFVAEYVGACERFPTAKVSAWR